MLVSMNETVESVIPDRVLRVLFPLVAAGLVAVGCARQIPLPTPTEEPETADSLVTPLVQIVATPSPQASRPTSYPTPMPSTTPTLVATTTRPTPTSAASPTLASPDLSIVLAPNGGPPGTTVQIIGYMPGGPTADLAKHSPSMDHAVICWAGCKDEIKTQLSPVTWSDTEPGHFTMRLIVPQTSWLSGSEAHALEPGDYEVGVQCLIPSVKVCLSQPPQAAASFHLTGPYPSTCQDVPCAWLRFRPASGPPGTVVKVDGWAPVAKLGDGHLTDYGSSYWLVLGDGPQGVGASGFQPSVRQAATGELSGEFRLTWLDPGSYQIVLEASQQNLVRFAATPFHVIAAESWVSLGATRPLLIQDDESLGGEAISAVSATSQAFAYCDVDSVRLTRDGGATWSTVPFVDAKRAIEAADYRIRGQYSPGLASCIAAFPDATHPTTVYATFPVAKKAYGPPPTFFVGLVTTDTGQTWRIVPAPSGYSAFDFGGFQPSDRFVEALFPGTTSPDGTLPFAVQATTDGGHSWSQSILSCPAVGPCIRWGPAPSEIGSCAMHTYDQRIEYSQDRGHTWNTPSWPIGANACGKVQLASLSPTTVLLIDSRDEYQEFPVLISRDGGHSWTVIGLPKLPSIPNLPSDAAIHQDYPGLRLLSDGSLTANVATGSTSGSLWILLRPGSSTWCSLAGLSVPAEESYLGPFHAIGQRLWWLRKVGPDGVPLAIESVPLANLHCAAP